MRLRRRHGNGRLQIRCAVATGVQLATPTFPFDRPGGPPCCTSGVHHALDRILHLPVAERAVRRQATTLALQTHALASSCVARRPLRGGVARAAHVPGVTRGTAIAWYSGTGRKRACCTASRVTFTVRKGFNGKVCQIDFPFAPRPSLRRESRRPTRGGFFFSAREKRKRPDRCGPFGGRQAEGQPPRACFMSASARALAALASLTHTSF